MTAHGTAESAVEAMKAGAADYVTKPFAMDELRLRVRRLAGQRERGARGARGSSRELTPDARAPRAPPMQAVLAAARQVAAHRRDGAAPRRERHRQEPARARRSTTAAPARGGAARRGPLRRAARDAPRERAVRPREGRVHRRGAAQGRPPRRRRRRDALPRRDRRDLAGDPGEAAALPPGAHASCRSAPPQARQRGRRG